MLRVAQGFSLLLIVEIVPVWETPFSAHLRRSTPDGRACRDPKDLGTTGFRPVLDREARLQQAKALRRSEITHFR